MVISKNMKSLIDFLTNYECQQHIDFSTTSEQKIKTLKLDAEKIKQYTNSANFLNEVNTIFSRYLNNLNSEELKRKGF